MNSDEIDQFAFRTAERLSLQALTCVSYLGDFDINPVKKFAQQNNQEEILFSFDKHAKDNMLKIRQRKRNGSIKELLIYLNSHYTLNRNLSLYTKFIVKVGKEENYVGTDLAANWYKTNLYIFTNILRQIKPTDKAVLVIFGLGHIPILKHFFESNPDIELVEVKDVLK